MTFIPDNSSSGNDLILNGNSKAADGFKDKKVTYKNQIRPSGSNAVRAGDRFGSVLDIYNDILLVGTANHKTNASGGASLNNAGAAWIFERARTTVPRKKLTKTRQKQIFTFTGSDQDFVVPENVERLTVSMVAGGGGGNTLGTFAGGNGAFVRATILVNSATTLKVIVGQGGIAGGTSAAYGGGGYLTAPGGIGGSGGGRSAISHPYLGDLLTAGAGGGAGKDGPGGHGGIVGGSGVTNKTVSHAVESTIHAKGAKGFVVGYNDSQRVTQYVVYGTSYDLRTTIVGNDNYLSIKHLGGNASPATEVPGNIFDNGAGGAGFAGGAAGPDGYGYRTSVTDSNPSKYDVGGSGSGGSSMVDPTPAYLPMTPEEEMITDVVTYDGNARFTSSEFESYGIGGTGSTAGTDGYIVIEWDEYEIDETQTDDVWSWTQKAKLIAEGSRARNANDLFGASVAVYGDYAFVGAPGQSYDAAGTPTVTSEAGAVFVYQQTSGVWTQVQKLVASGTNARVAGDKFGSAVAFANGRLYVGAPGQDFDATGVNEVSNAGAVFVFELSGSTWTQTARLVANGVNSRTPDDAFGYKLSASGDAVAISSLNSYDPFGNTLSEGACSVFLYENNGAWTQTARLTGANIAGSTFGSAISLRDNLLSVESAGVKGRYVYSKSGGNWVLDTTLSTALTSNILMYSRLAPFDASFTTGINGVGITLVNMANTGDAWFRYAADLDRTYTSLIRSYNMADLNNPFVRTTGVAFADRTHFTLEQWIHPYDPRSLGGYESDNALLPVVRRSGLWGLYMTTDKMEFNAGQYLMEFTKADNSKVRYDFGTLDRRAWQHLAIVRDGDEIRTYVNGKLRKSYDVTGVVLQDAATNIVWGYDAAQSPFQPPRCFLREFKVSSTALFKGNFSVNLADTDLSVAGADLATGRGAATLVFDENTILSAKPTGHGNALVNHTGVDRNDATKMHPELSVSKAGLVDVTARYNGIWEGTDTNIVAPGFQALREQGAKFGMRVSINKDRLIVTAPESTFVGRNGQRHNYRVGDAYVFDVQGDNVSYKTKLIHRGLLQYDNLNRFFGGQKINENGKDWLSDYNYVGLFPVHVNMNYGGVNGSSIIGMNAKKIFEVQASGRNTRYNSLAANVVGVSTELMKSIVVTNSAWATAQLVSYNPTVTSITYVAAGVSALFPRLDQPITKNGEYRFFADPLGVRANPNWHNTTSGYVAPLLWNGVNEFSYAQTFSYPGSYVNNRNQGDAFAASVVTDGTSVFASEPGSGKTETANSGASNRGAVHRLEYAAWAQGWQLKEFILPTTGNNSYFGVAIDVAGDYMISKSTNIESAVNVYKKVDGAYSFLERFVEARSDSPSQNTSAAFFETEARFVTGSPDFNLGTKSKIGYAHLYNQEIDGTYEPTGVDYSITTGSDDRTADAVFGTSMAIDGTKLVVGAPGYNQITGGTAVRTGMGGAFSYDKIDGVWAFSALYTNETNDLANQRWGEKVDIKDGRVLTMPASLSQISVYSTSGTFEQRIANTGAGSTQAVFLNDALIAVGQPLTNPDTASNNVTSGSFSHFVYDTTWTKGTNQNIPQHTNGAYDYGTIGYGLQANAGLARGASNLFGTSIEVSDDKSSLMIGAPGHQYQVNPNNLSARSNQGAVFSYYWDATKSQWRLNTKIISATPTANDNFGSNLNKTSDSSFIVSSWASASRQGAISHIARTGTGVSAAWSPTYSYTNGTINQDYGSDVAYDSVRDLYYVGSPTRNEGGVASGTFETMPPQVSPTRTTYNLSGNINNRNATDQFGYSISVFNDKIAIGVPNYDYDTPGTTLYANRGAVYTYTMSDSGLFHYDQKLTFETQSSGNYGGFVGLNDTTLMVFGSSATPVVFNRDVNGKFGSQQTVTPAPTVSVPVTITPYRAAWDNVTKNAAIGSFTGNWNIPNMLNNYGGIIPIVHNEDDTYSVVDLGVVAQQTNINNVVHNFHIYINQVEGFAVSTALSPDGSMLAVGAPRDIRHMSGTSSITVAGMISYGKVWIYRWSATANKFVYHSLILTPVLDASVTQDMKVSWQNDKLMVSQNSLNRAFVYELYDDRFWRITTTTSMEASLTSAILAKDGTAIVMAKPTSAGYPNVVGSGAVRTQILNGSVWGSGRGINAGADAEAFSTAVTAGGGGGAGAIGGLAGSAVNMGYGSGGKGGSNLLPSGFTEILSNNSDRANPTDTNAWGGGANVLGGHGEDARIIITAGSETTIFNFTGFDQFYVVPAGITEITVSLWGAGGGAANNVSWNVNRSGRGGAGAFVTGTLPVTEGETLTLVVGGGGIGGVISTDVSSRKTTRRYGLGGLGGRSINSNIDAGGAGGGLAGIKRGNDFIVIAGGGGGGSTRNRTLSYRLDGTPGGYAANVDPASYLDTVPGSDEVFAPGIVNSRNALDYFGMSVAIKDENRIFIGAPGHDYDSEGDAIPSNAGAIFEYKFVNGRWQLIQKVVSGTPTQSEGFGNVIDIVDDKLLVIGKDPINGINGIFSSQVSVLGNNTIEVFTLVDGKFESQAKRVNSVVVDANSSITMVGDKIVLGTPRKLTDGVKPSVSAGGFDTFSVTPPTLTLLETTVGNGVSHGRFANDNFGTSVEITPTQIFVGVPGHDYGNNGVNQRTDQGSIFVFDKKPTGYAFRTKLNLAPESTETRLGNTLKLIGDKLYAGVNDTSKSVEFTGAAGNWTLSRQIAATAGRIAEIVSSTKLIELDKNGNAGVGSQPTLTNAGRAKSYTIGVDGTLTDTNADYSIPGRSNGRNIGDLFGYSVYANHDFVVVGAPGHQFDDVGRPAGSTGALFVFNKAGTKWNPESKIVSDEETSIGFGQVLAGRNGWIITSGQNATTGVARVYQRVAEGNWQVRYQADGEGTNGNSFGASVAAADTSKFVVGIPKQDSIPGLVSVTDSGAIHTYERIGEDWFDRDMNAVTGAASGRNPGDWFGYHVSTNKSYVVIGSPQYAFDEFGDVELANAGAIWIYLKDEKYSLITKVVSGTRGVDNRFGTTVGIDEKSNTIVVGEPGSNSVHVYGFDGETATLIQTLNPTLDQDEVFGQTVAINDGKILVGSKNASTDADGQNALTDAGAVYVFLLDNSTGLYSLSEKITGFTDENGDPMPMARVAGDLFGAAIALDETGSMIVGAPGHDYDRDGANSVTNAGAAYLRKL